MTTPPMISITVPDQPVISVTVTDPPVVKTTVVSPKIEVTSAGAPGPRGTYRSVWPNRGFGFDGPFWGLRSDWSDWFDRTDRIYRTAGASWLIRGFLRVLVQCEHRRAAYIGSGPAEQH